MDKYWITSEALFDIMRTDSSRGSIRMSEYNYLVATVSNSGRCYEIGEETPDEDIDKDDLDLLVYDDSFSGPDLTRNELKGEQKIFFISKTAVIQLIQKGMYSDGDILIEVDDD